MNLMSSAPLIGDSFSDFNIVLPQQDVTITFNIHQNTIGEAVEAEFELPSIGVSAISFEPSSETIPMDVIPSTPGTYVSLAVCEIRMRIF